MRSCAELTLSPVHSRGGVVAFVDDEVGNEVGDDKKPKLSPFRRNLLRRRVAEIGRRQPFSSFVHNGVNYQADIVGHAVHVFMSDLQPTVVVD